MPGFEVVFFVELVLDEPESSEKKRLQITAHNATGRRTATAICFFFSAERAIGCLLFSNYCFGAGAFAGTADATGSIRSSREKCVSISILSDTMILLGPADSGVLLAPSIAPG